MGLPASHPTVRQVIVASDAWGALIWVCKVLEGRLFEETSHCEAHATESETYEG